MKHLFLVVLCALSFGASAQTAAAAIQKGAAVVPQEQGVYVFVDCAPVAEYTYLGTISLGMSWSGTLKEVKQTLIKKTKKQYPSADGIIMKPIGEIMGDAKADIIKFK